MLQGLSLFKISLWQQVTVAAYIWHAVIYKIGYGLISRDKVYRNGGHTVIYDKID